MKTALSVLALVLSATSSYASLEESILTAGPGEIITGPQAQQIKTAVSSAISEAKFECKVSVGNTYTANKVILESAQGAIQEAPATVMLDRSGTQPAIVIESASHFASELVAITTSSDSKRVIEFTYDYSKLVKKNVNSGTLLDPVLTEVTAREPVFVATCRAI